MKFLILPVFVLVSLTGFARRKKEAEPPFSHRLQFASMYQHIGDPDWKDQWWRRNMIPQYQLGYKNYYVKIRFFSTGEYNIRQREDMGKIYTPTEVGLDGQQKIKDGSVIHYTYLMKDIVGSFNIIGYKNQNLQLGVGASHRKGQEAVVLFMYPGFQMPHYEGQLVERNQWGVVGELSYSVNFLKYAIFSLETAYRVYPNGPSLFTAGAALGVRIRHQVPAKPNNWLPFQRQ